MNVAFPSIPSNPKATASKKSQVNLKLFNEEKDGKYLQQVLTFAHDDLKKEICALNSEIQTQIDQLEKHKEQCIREYCETYNILGNQLLDCFAEKQNLCVTIIGIPGSDIAHFLEINRFKAAAIELFFAQLEEKNYEPYFGTWTEGLRSQIQIHCDFF